MPRGVAPLSDLGVVGENPIHRPLRAKVAVLVEQARVDLRGSLVGEARLVQEIEHGTPFRDGQGSSRCCPWRRLVHFQVADSTSLAARPTPGTGGRRQVSDREGRRSPCDSSLGNGRPNSAASFFESRRWPRGARRASSAWRCDARARRSFCRAGSTATVFGPRFFVAAPGAEDRPSPRATRQAASCEEYSPSRRSSAPISPGALQASVSFTILRLYSTVNDRRLAFSGLHLGVLAEGRYRGRGHGGSPARPAPLNFMGSGAVSLTLAERGRSRLEAVSRRTYRNQGNHTHSHFRLWD